VNIVDGSVLIISVLFGLYGLASAVEYGIVIKMLRRDEASKKMFTPLWEVTNVFLVFGFTGLAMLFNGALTRLSSALMATLGVAITAMLIRACLVLYIFYMNSEQKISGPTLWLFSGTTFLVPITFTSAGIYLLSGKLFWQSLLGIVLMLMAIGGLSSIGLLILGRKSTPRQQLSAKLLFVGWLWLIGCLLPLVTLHTTNTLNKTSLLGLIALAACGLGLMLLEFVQDKNLKMWRYGALSALLVPTVLAWAGRPYLIAGKLTLNQAYGAQTYGSAVVIGMAILTPLILVGFYIFARLLNDPVEKKR